MIPFSHINEEKVPLCTALFQIKYNQVQPSKVLSFVSFLRKFDFFLVYYLGYVGIHFD